jgi:hypothetical protein
LIAQEVEPVLPEAVSDSSRGAGVSYTMLIPVLIEAVKELKGEVDELRAEVARLTAALSEDKPARRSRKSGPAKAGT